MKSWLYPGAKVVCVDSDWSGNASPLERDRVYVVAAVEIGAGFRPGQGWKTAILVRLRGVDFPNHIGFDADRFRPLTKRSTDTQVSKLKRLLNTTPADLEREGV